jgi:hypothetical protein
METAVAVLKEQVSVPQVAQQGNDLQALGFNTNDILIPRLRLMQPTSEEVGDEKFKMGDIVESLAAEKLGGVDTPLEIVPIHIFKTWRNYRVDGEFKARGGKLVSVTPVTAENEKQPWEGTETIDGKPVPVRRDLSYNAYVLLKRDLESSTAFPMNIVFKRTSANAGKQLVSLVYRLGMMGTPMFGKSILLGASKQKKDTNSWAIFEVKTGGAVSSEHQEVCKKWQQIVKTAAVRVDETEDNEGEAKAKAPAVVISGSPEESPY